MELEITTKDWFAIAKAAGEHGVRYKTNASLTEFIRAAVAPLIAQEAAKEIATLQHAADDVYKRLMPQVEAQAKEIAELRAARPLVEALIKQLIGLGMGGCTCGVKSPQAHWHEPTCTFRRAEEALDNAEAIRKAIG